MKCIFCTTLDSLGEHIGQLMDTYVIFKNYSTRRQSKYWTVNNPKTKSKYYLTIFAEPKVNKCFSMIAQTSVFEFCCKFILLLKPFCKEGNICIYFVTILLISCINIPVITSHKVVIVRYDVVLDKSECMYLYDQWSNYTNTIY